MEIDVHHVPAEGMMLHFLDQRETAGLFFASVDFEIHEDVLAGGVREEIGDLFFVDLEVLWQFTFGVDVRRDGAFAPDLFDDSSSGAGASLCFEFRLFSHGSSLLGFADFEKGSHRLVVVNALDAFAE
jgi:hypothetical protein